MLSKSLNARIKFIFLITILALSSQFCETPSYVTYRNFESFGTEVYQIFEKDLKAGLSKSELGLRESMIERNRNPVAGTLDQIFSEQIQSETADSLKAVLLVGSNSNTFL